MENASKALIIAGAILLSILIISTGMYIYNSSQNAISGAVSQISQQEIDAFNRQWEMYEGKQTGANVRALISRLNSNATLNAEEETKLPNLYYEATSTKKGRILSVTANPKGGTKNGFNTARTQIQLSHVYRVTLVTHPTTGLISGIMITYNADNDVTGDNIYKKIAEDEKAAQITGAQIQIL